MSTTKLDSTPALSNSTRCFDSNSIVICKLSCNRVRHFLVRLFQSVLFGPSFSDPANSVSRLANQDTVSAARLLYKTAELSQRRPRDAPNIWVHWKVLRVLITHPTTFPEICNELLFRSILRMCVQNFKFVALPVHEIIWSTQKLGQSLNTPTLHFLPKF